MAITVDIFCRVIDNYGDAGVCLHLGRNLSTQESACTQESAFQVRLFCDDLTVMHTIANAADYTNPNLSLCPWKAPLDHYEPSDVVIGAFGCRFDTTTLAALQRSQQQGERPLIINLEYLSAESWVEDCHLLPSLADGLTCYFLFPGFTARTGGLNLDRAFLAQCQAQLDQAQLDQAQLDQAQLDQAQLDQIQLDQVQLDQIQLDQAQLDQIQLDQAQLDQAHTIPPAEPYTVSLFGYDNPAVARFISALERDGRRWQVQIFSGLAQDNFNRLYQQNLQVGESWTQGSVTCTIVPMTDHQGYDQVLLTSTINLVRGEDSIVRAMHTGHPFLWQIYPQDEQAHIIKLKAFLDCMERTLEGTIPELTERMALLRATMLSYNEACNGADPLLEPNFIALLLERCGPLFTAWARHLCAQPTLCENLSRFIVSKLSELKA